MSEITPHHSLSALENVLVARAGRREGREIRFRCPAHDDTHPSARWNPGKETWFCDVCLTGGGRLDLLRRLGLDDATDGNRHRSGTIVATYPYHDTAGHLLYEIVRLCPKGFRIRRPAAGGGWTWNLGGVRRVLYRLVDLAAAVAAGSPVFLVEGEKDADALARLGLAATTSPGGAGKWHADYAEPLRGAQVVLLPDNDEPGRRHMEEAARTLAPLAASLRLLALPGLPERGDVSDWLAAQAAATPSPDALRARLLELVRRAPAWPAPPPLTFADFPGLICTRDIEPRAIRFLWRPYLPLGKITLLEGDPGQGKSWLTTALAAYGSTGRALPGGPPTAPFRTLFLTAEEGLNDTLRPHLDAFGVDHDFVFVYDQLPCLAAERDLTTLDRLLGFLDPRLLIVDPIVAFIGARTDLYRANEVRAVLAPLAKLADRHDCSLLGLRHLNKVKAGRSIYAGQGSIDFTATARSVLLAGSAPGDPNHFALVHIKCNLAPLGPACGYAIENNAFAWTGVSRLTAADLLAAESRADDRGAEDAARAFLRDTLGPGPCPARDLFAAAQEAGISARTLKRAKLREGVLSARQGFGPGSAVSWSLPGPPHRGPASPSGTIQGQLPIQGHGPIQGHARIQGHTQSWPPMEPGTSPQPAEPDPDQPRPDGEPATEPGKAVLL
ncbi:MAG TPA: AAA family ATPase [Thermoanaerobaculia bacterium]|nr:AAA family ATPase [Thermoanaerobaculia bacterium]